MNKILYFSLQNQKRYAKLTQTLRFLSRCTSLNSCQLTFSAEHFALHLRESDESECKAIATFGQLFFSRYKFARDDRAESAHFALCQLGELVAFLETYKGRACELTFRVGEARAERDASSELTANDLKGFSLEAKVRLEVGVFEFGALLARARPPRTPPRDYFARVAAKRVALVQLPARQLSVLEVLKGSGVVFEFRRESLELSGSADAHSSLALAEAQFRDYNHAAAARALRDDRLAVGRHLLQSLMALTLRSGATHLSLLAETAVRENALKLYFALEGEEVAFAARARCSLVRAEPPRPSREAVAPPSLAAPVAQRVNAGAAEQNSLSLQQTAVGAPPSLRKPIAAHSAQTVEAIGAAKPICTPAPPFRCSPGDSKRSQLLVNVCGQSYAVDEKFAKMREANAAKVSEVRGFFSEREFKK